jgi:hypothetical protein
MRGRTRSDPQEIEEETVKQKFQARQGDCLLIEVDSIPADATEDCRDKNGLPVLAYGEVSGHAHCIEEVEPGQVSYRKTPDGRRFIELLKTSIATNLKHGNLTNKGVSEGTGDHSAILLRGKHLQQAFQVEDFGEEIRRVED